VTNPNPSEQFPPRPDLARDDRRRRGRTALLIRFGIFGIFLIVGIVLLATHRYTAGTLFIAWAVIRSAMILWRIRRRRQRAQDWGGR
jgi:membrane protein implicated in regulation of membrane protease activity